MKNMMALLCDWAKSTVWEVSAGQILGNLLRLRDSLGGLLFRTRPLPAVESVPAAGRPTAVPRPSGHARDRVFRADFATPIARSRGGFPANFYLTRSERMRYLTHRMMAAILGVIVLLGLV